MSTFNKQVTVSYTAEQMYALVNDINAYSTFIPLCSSSVVHEADDHRLRATIRIATGKIGFGFTTLNAMEKGRSITMRLEKGPFKSLSGIWRFIPQDENKSIISLQFDFEFANKLMGAALNGLFAQLCDSMVEAFRHEAAFRYEHTVSPAHMEHVYR